MAEQDRLSAILSSQASGAADRGQTLQATVLERAEAQDQGQGLRAAAHCTLLL